MRFGRVAVGLVVGATVVAMGCGQQDPGGDDPAAGTAGVAGSLGGAAPAAGAPSGVAGSGLAGMAGVAGSSGAPGVAGMAGMAGVAGSSGTAGMAGMAGADAPPAAGADAPPAAGAAGSEPSTGTDYYPLEDGAEWAYQHRGGTLPWTEVVTVRAVEHQGQPAFEMRDTPGPGGVRSVQILVREGGLVTRVHSQELTDDVPSAVIDYDPGFARFDHAWLSMAPGSSITLDYQRVERDPAGVLVTDELRSHRYDMLAVDQSVTVPAGTFDGCLQVKRTRMPAPGSMPMPGDIETFWFCGGVGKVKEIEDLSGKTEELERCNLPACTQ